MSYELSRARLFLACSWPSATHVSHHRRSIAILVKLERIPRMLLSLPRDNLSHSICHVHQVSGLPHSERSERLGISLSAAACRSKSRGKLAQRALALKGA